jgi:hypothetical protein
MNFCSTKTWRCETNSVKISCFPFCGANCILDNDNVCSVHVFNCYGLRLACAIRILVNCLFQARSCALFFLLKPFIWNFHLTAANIMLSGEKEHYQRFNACREIPHRKYENVDDNYPEFCVGGWISRRQFPAFLIVAHFPKKVCGGLLTFAPPTHNLISPKVHFLRPGLASSMNSAAIFWLNFYLYFNCPSFVYRRTFCLPSLRYQINMKTKFVQPTRTSYSFFPRRCFKLQVHRWGGKLLRTSCKLYHIARRNRISLLFSGNMA